MSIQDCLCLSNIEYIRIRTLKLVYDRESEKVKDEE